MFGYVKPYTRELKVRENELYQAIYCGVCRSMGKSVSRFSRLTLSYDMVFLALVRASLSGHRFRSVPRRCPLNPFKKRPAADDCDILRYCSAVSAQLSYYGIIDNIKDSRGIKKLGYKMLLPFFKTMKKRSYKIADFDDGVIKEYLDELDMAEIERSPQLDRAADAFGKLLAYFSGFGLPEKEKASAETVGLNVGRYIYACDACDDFEDDIKNGNYNPLRYGEGSIEDKLKRAYGAMCVWADTAAGELLLEGAQTPETDVAENILKLGLIDTAKKITGKKGEKKHGKRSV